MTSYLLATASVHVTAAAADYLADRLDPADDHLVVVGVRDAPGTERDAGDAANVARSRLATVMPEVDLRDGDPTEEVLAAVEEYDADVLVVGPNDGTPAATGLGSTARALVESADVPVIVVPVAH